MNIFEISYNENRIKNYLKLETEDHIELKTQEILVSTLKSVIYWKLYYLQNVWVVQILNGNNSVEREREKERVGKFMKEFSEKTLIHFIIFLWG